MLLYAELYAVAVDLLILEADNLSTLFPDASATVFGIVVPPERLFLLVSAAVVLPTVWLRDLSLLAYISTTGVLSTLLVVLGVVWIGAVDGVGFTHQGQLLRLSGLPAAAGLFGFCFSGHAVLPNIYRSMKDPSQFLPVSAPLSLAVLVLALVCQSPANDRSESLPLRIFMSGDRPCSAHRLLAASSLRLRWCARGSLLWPCALTQVMVTSFLICLAMYGGIAVAGYAMFGDDLKEQITLNLPPGLLATNVVIWTTVLTPFTKYALTVTPLAILLEEWGGVHSYTDPSWAAFFKGTCLRTALVVSGVVVAAMVPFFGLVVAFTGSFLSLSISVVLPCIFAYQLLPRGRTWTHPAILFSVLALGLVSAVAGTYYSIKGIANKYHA